MKAYDTSLTCRASLPCIHFTTFHYTFAFNQSIVSFGHFVFLRSLYMIFRFRKQHSVTLNCLAIISRSSSSNSNPLDVIPVCDNGTILICYSTKKIVWLLWCGKVMWQFKDRVMDWFLSSQWRISNNIGKKIVLKDTI